MLNSLQPILDRVPFLAARSDLEIKELSGGITNRNYRIEADGQAYVLRLGGNNTNLLDIDRKVEYGCTLAAWRAGVAPEPVAFLEPEGYLLTRFIEGKGISAEEIGTPQNIQRVVAVIHQYQSVGQFPGFFSPFRVVDSFLPTAQHYGAPLPANLDWFLTVSREIETTFLRDPMQLKPCHNDLLNGNFIDDGQTIRILDWEYGGMDDPFFDLANFSAQHGFNEDQDALVLTAYFGKVEKAQMARQNLMKIMSDMREAFWAMVQCNVSQIEFDYVGYGRKYFDRIEEVTRHSNYAKWLEAVNNK